MSRTNDTILFLYLSQSRDSEKRFDSRPCVPAISEQIQIPRVQDFQILSGNSRRNLKHQRGWEDNCW